MLLANTLAMITSKPVHLGLVLLAGSLSLPYFVACSGDTESSTGAGGMVGSVGGSGTGPGTTGAGGNGGDGTTVANPTTTTGNLTTAGGWSSITTAAETSTTGSSSSEYLFECGLELSCAPLCSHLGWSDCGGDFMCVEQVWGSGENGVLLLQSRPGPGGSESDTLLVLLGDGRVLMQDRFRSCPNNGFNCDLAAIPWSFGEQRRCDVGAEFSPQGENCFSVNHSCDEVKGLLEGGTGGSAGAGGEAGHAGEAAE